MTAALGTLTFLATLWLLVVLGAVVLEESGAKIAAALKGNRPRRPVELSARIRTRRPSHPVSWASQQWRAAA